MISDHNDIANALGLNVLKYDLAKLFATGPNNNPVMNSFDPIIPIILITPSKLI